MNLDDIQIPTEPFKPILCDFCSRIIQSSDDWVCEEGGLNACGECAKRFEVEDRLSSITGTELRVALDLQARQKKGIQKYGQTVENNPLPLKEWLQHAYEETLDTAIYLKRAMEELK